MFRRPRKNRYRLSAEVHQELIGSLVANPTPSAIMSVLFVVTAVMVARDTNDTSLTLLLAAGSALSAARLYQLFWMRARLAADAVASRDARRLELHYASLYIAFAAVVGTFAARVLLIGRFEMATAATVLVVGYAAGVAAIAALRPWIAISSMLLAVVPTVVATVAFAGGSYHGLVGAMLTAFLGGGLTSVATRYRTEVENIGMRTQLSSLARHDALTGLDNRLSLTEHFSRYRRSADGECLNAIHCLDLDGFKLINDRYGHPVGDSLLIAVAGRLRGLLREGDIAVRLGGDEFAFLQTRLRHNDEAHLAARRIAKALVQPYAIDGHTISIGVSLGFVVSQDCDDPLDTLVAKADNALYTVKRAGGGIAEHSDLRVEKAFVA